MSFLYPLGLLGLIGVPIIILIYILKNKHTEQVISSTFLWSLSEKFLKRRKPISRLAGIISLILELLVVIIASLVISHPVITLKNQAFDYCFILDGSGSMNFVIDKEESIFEKGKKEIESIIAKSKKGSTYSLVLASYDANVIYENISDKQIAISLLNNLESSDTIPTSALSLKYAQEYFNINPSQKTYLITSHDYDVENVNLINVYKDVVNYSINDLTYKITNSKLEISGKVSSNTSEATTLNLNLSIDNVPLDTKNISFSGESLFKFEIDSIDFDSIKVEITNKDSLEKDNTNIIYNVMKEHGRSVLIISEKPFYLESVLKTNGTTSIQTITPSQYNDSISGYGLYIFDSFSPDVYPNDGVLWLFNISTNTNNLGFAYQDEFDLGDSSIKIEQTNYPNSTYKQLSSGLLGNDIYLCKYMKYGLYRNFTTLYEYEGLPIIFAGTNSYNNRQIVFAFDLHNSNFPLLMDYILLTNNLVEYSFPTIIDQSFYRVGDIISINVISNCKSIKVVTPSEKTTYVNVNQDISDYRLIESGTYNIIVSNGQNETIFKVFASIPSDVSSNIDTLKEYKIKGEPGTNQKDGIYDSLVALLIIVSIALILDWGVYCYEQYQLR